MVVVIGHKLMDELLLSESRSTLDRELQAELRFGEEQSRNQKLSDFIDLAKLFFAQDDDWREAESEIADLRDEMTEEKPSTLGPLELAAGKEIIYNEAIWAGNYTVAVDAAQQVITALSGGEELKGYRAMWHYLAGCAAALDAKDQGKFKSDKAQEHFRLAKRLGSSRWLGRIVENQPLDLESTTPPEDELAVERMEAQLCELGLIHEGDFAKYVTNIRAGIGQGKAKLFEATHRDLGELLGFRSEKSDAQAAPDPWWISGDSLCFVFEDHTEGQQGKDLSVDKARQASSHPAWIKANVSGLSDDADIIPVLVTNANTKGPVCKVQLQSVAVWPLKEFRAWSSVALDVIRELRAKLNGQGDLVWRAEALKMLGAVNATPSTLALVLKSYLGKQ